MTTVLATLAFVAWSGFIYWLGYGDGRMREQDRAKDEALGLIRSKLEAALPAPPCASETPKET